MNLKPILFIVFFGVNAFAVEVITPQDTGDYFQVIAPPKSVTMESGIVKIQPSKSGHSHSTKNYEEMLYVLDGSGEMIDKTGKFPFKAGDIIYVGPNTEHQVFNTGTTTLKYIYIAAKTPKN